MRRLARRPCIAWRCAWTKAKAPQREFAGNCHTLNQDECEGRALVVYAEHHAGITEDVLSFNGVFSGHEHQFVAVQDKPDRRNMWAAVGTNGDLRSALSEEQKRMPLAGVMDFMMGAPHSGLRRAIIRGREGGM